MERNDIVEDMKNARNPELWHKMSDVRCRFTFSHTHPFISSTCRPLIYSRQALSSTTVGIGHHWLLSIIIAVGHNLCDHPSDKVTPLPLHNITLSYSVSQVRSAAVIVRKISKRIAQGHIKSYNNIINKQTNNTKINNGRVDK